MLNEAAIKLYLLNQFPDVTDIHIRKLGSGVQGSGFLAEIHRTDGDHSYVIKTLIPEGLGHDYPADRASVFLLDLDEFNNLPEHVKALDVLAEMEDGTIKSIGGGREYYLLMERAEGIDYFNDLRGFSARAHLERPDIQKIRTMTSCLAKIHSEKKNSKTLYWRKLRDTVGHGECLMGVFDTYPDGVLKYEEMSDIVKKAVDWTAKLKPFYNRLCRIHGDFHPGNIWFHNNDFILLDRSRGPWGEPADDVTAMTVNYIFFSVMEYNEVRGAFYEGLKIFFDEYIMASGDSAITSFTAPFFAFRGAVVANPLFYPQLTQEQRRIIFRFVHNVLDDKAFNYEKIQEYLK